MQSAYCPRWYAIFVRTNYERTITKQLAMFGEETFLPLNKDERNTPLFPGYVFCKTELHKGIRLYSIRGVIRILGNHAGPVALADEEIVAVKRMHMCGLRVYSYSQVYSVDQRVRLSSGPLQGVSGTIVENINDIHFVVSIPLLMRSVSVQVDPSWLQPA